MQTLLRPFVVRVVLGLFAVTASSLHAEAYRTWTNTAGRQVEATLIAVDLQAKTLKIMLKGGREFNVPFASFSPADVEYAKSRYAALQAASPTKSASSSKFDPTHRQVDVLKPAHGPTAVTMNTFLLNPEGDIVTAISPRAIYSSGGVSKPAPGTPAGWIQVYSPDKQLKQEIELPFAPAALALTKDGHYLVAGGGQLCKCTLEGKIVAQTDLLKLLNIDEGKLREEVIEQYKKDQETYAASRNSQIKSIKDQIARLEEKPASGLTARDKSRLQSLNSMLRSLDSANTLTESRIGQLMQYRMRTPSISPAGNDIMVTLARNRGYEIWRTGPQFESPRRVLGDMRGCCGQMDMTVAGDRILTAENTKFRVGIYDLEGKSISGFGERFKDDNHGFGSCCNPMNVLCCANGDILTAESSIGHIKRFNDKGELQAVIGRARIGGGCKHVALGFDAARDRYYVQYQDMNHICIMLPNAEAAPLMMELDQKMKAAEDAALKLVGTWKAVNAGSASQPAADSSDPYEYTPEPRFDSFSFKADHSLTLKLDSAPRTSSDKGFRRWYVSGLENGRMQFEIEHDDGYVDFATQIAMRGDDEIEMKLTRETKVFKRQN
jgi:hypothetical protein